MKDVVSRRALLFGKSGPRGLDDIIRPPWAVDAGLFAGKCTGCAACVDACPENILILDVHKKAKVDFSQGECTFCTDCVTSCKDGALVMADINRPWSLQVSIEGTCLAMKGVECRICDDQCDPRAIRFRITPGGVSLPQLDQDVCTGCGACVAPCPVSALQIMPEQVREGA
ncbi:ferredoxin-type protein NapF [Terasakiella pusilla]|uniref:ferredoxin-type protein NapF n=1 Tax=Terasakiella pusilla TaxID=64973 RepID=UPI003AA9811D